MAERKYKGFWEYFIDGKKVSEEEARRQMERNQRLLATGNPEDLDKCKFVRMERHS